MLRRQRKADPATVVVVGIPGLCLHPVLHDASPPLPTTGQAPGPSVVPEPGDPYGARGHPAVETGSQGFLGCHVRLPVEERREAVAEMTSGGMRNREIAEVLGVDESTVRADKRAGNPAARPKKPQVKRSSATRAAGNPAPKTVTRGGTGRRRYARTDDTTLNPVMPGL